MGYVLVGLMRGGKDKKEMDVDRPISDTSSVLVQLVVVMGLGSWLNLGAIDSVGFCD